MSAGHHSVDIICGAILTMALSAYLKKHLGVLMARLQSFLIIS